MWNIPTFIWDSTENYLDYFSTDPFHRMHIDELSHLRAVAKNIYIMGCEARNIRGSDK